MTPLDHALNLAARGLPVFPCGASKKPTCKKGFHAASRDELKVRALWHESPGCLVGVPTGSLTGIDVLDIDPKHGGDEWLLQNQHRLPLTRVHRTRSGGEHWIFRHLAGIRNSQAKIALGVDTRGSGGYIIWWPAFGGAITCTARVAPWPSWLLTTLFPKPIDEARSQAWRERIAGDATEARRLIQKQLERVAHAAPGQRHTRLRAAARTIGGLLDLDDSITRADAERRLLDAVVDAGGNDVDRNNAKKTIVWGLDQGVRAPLRIRGRDA